MEGDSEHFTLNETFSIYIARDGAKDQYKVSYYYNSGAPSMENCYFLTNGWQSCEDVKIELENAPKWAFTLHDIGVIKQRLSKLHARGA